MWIARPAADDDVPSLMALAEMAPPHVHTLPRTHDAIEEAIAHTREALARLVDAPADEHYQLVLEDDTGAIVGTAAIAATAGSAGAYFSYRNDVVHHVSRDLRIANNVHVLTLNSDLTAHSQLSGLQVASGHAAAATLLSRARLMLAAADRRRFADSFFACLPGQTFSDHTSPFWNAIGRKFFNMDYLSAERAVRGARNGTLIVELMPHYPVYVPLLPEAACEVIGQLHPAASTAFDILAGEGFEVDRYVDIFDGGPVLEAHASRLRTLSTTRTLTVAEAVDSRPGETCLIATATATQAFRCAMAPATVELDRGRILLSAATQDALHVGTGDAVIVASA